MKVILEDIPYVLDDNWCGGGYLIDDEIHIDKRLSPEKMKLTIVHEVLEKYLSGRVKHSRIDRVAIDIIDALMQVK